MTAPIPLPRRSCRPTDRRVRGEIHRKPRSSPATTRTTVVAFLLLAADILRARPADAYASWLKCYIDLEDEEESIMRQSILPFANQPQESRVYIEVQPYASSRTRDPWKSSSPQNHRELFPPPVYNNVSSTLLKVRLKVPPSLRNKNVQFVVDVDATNGKGAAFVGPGAMCDGNRASSTRHDGDVLLRVNTTGAATTTTANDHEDVAEPLLGDIELIAGWATGYGAVKLTPKMVLRRGGSDTSSSQEKQTTSSDGAPARGTEQHGEDGDGNGNGGEL